MAATTSRAADRRRAPSPRRPIGRVPILGLSLALLVLSLGTLADPASAATAGVSDGQLTYTADAGEQNDVTILPDGLDLTIRDTGPGVTITAEPGCSTTSADTVTCSSLPGFGLVFVDAGDMDDRVVLSEFPTTVFVPAVLFGGDGGDTLLSGNGDDLLVGCRGDDTLHGFYGDDVLANEFICAGGGDDTFYGGFGADSFSGIGGTETASYSEPKGESGYGQGPRQASVTVTLDNVADDGELGEGDNAMADVEGVVGGEGDDTLTGNSAANSLDGAEGDDTLDGGLGADVLDGGLMAMPEDPDEDPPARNDTVSYASHSSDVAVDVSPQAVGSASPVNGENCVLGEDPIDQPAECEGDTVARFRHATGGSGDDDLLGDDESNTLRGGGGGDTLDGRGSNDTLEGGAGSDDLYGGEDNDTIRARDGESDSVFCDGGTQDWAEADAAGTDTEIVDCEEVERPRPPGAGIARLQGSTLSFEAGDGEVNDVTVSSSGSDFVITDTGASLVTSSSVCSEGAPGSVTCADPGAAVDTISLTLGDEGDSASIDPTVSASIAAVIDGGEGEDQLSGGDGSDTLDGGPEANVADTLNGGGGSDTVTYADRSAPVNVSLDGVVNDGENCPGPDCEGDDIATNIENVTGSEGDDTLSGDTAANSFSGGPGTDTVSYEDRSQPVTVTLDDTSDDGANGGAEGDNVGSDVENLIGGAGADTLIGSAEDNTFIGGEGADTFDGLEGPPGDPDSDTVSYEDRSQPVTVTMGDATANDGEGCPGPDCEGDTIEGTVENVTGGAGADTLTGDAGPNTLRGGRGVDTLRGQGGDDILEGGPEADVADTIDGGGHGPGGDTVSYADRSQPVTVTLAGGVNDGETGENDVLSGVENVTGGSNDDHLTAGSADSTLVGGDGDDVLNGGGGDDHLSGGSGDDTLDGGEGGDDMVGNGGEDTATYETRTEDVTVIVDHKFLADDDGEDGEGDNVYEDVENVVGGEGNDTLKGNFEGNTLDGGPGDDTLNGRHGNDTLIGGAGADTLIGSLGSGDTVSYEDRSAPVTVTLDNLANDGNLDDRSVDPLGDDRDTVEDTVENITGGSGDDTLTGNALPNTLNGGPGDDTLDGGEESDVIIGGDGADTATYEDRSEPVVAGLGGVAASGVAGEGDRIETDVEHLTGGQAGDRLSGDSGPNTLSGGPGEDILSGDRGADTLNGGADPDTLTGGSGSDTLNGDGGSDTLRGGADPDILNGGPGDDTLDGGLGADILGGGPGSDSADYSQRTRAVTVDPGDGADDGERGEGDTAQADVEGASGGTGNDSLTGNSENGALDGGLGDDTLDGGLGSDVLIGGPGSDTASYAGRGAPVAVNLSSAGGDGQAGEGDDVRSDVEHVIGGRGPDTLVGSGASNTLSGGPGNDLLQGAGGQDLLQGGTGQDTLEGQAGGDDLRGGDQGDALSGGPGDDSLDGQAGNDTLRGNGGADTLSGGPGSDTADYSARTAALSLSIDGGPNDGQAGERDNVREDVESLRSGSGADTINTHNGLPNTVSCGPGGDSATIDSRDQTGADCEEIVTTSDEIPVKVRILTASATMTRSGRVYVRIICEATVRCEGRLTLRTAGRVRVSARRQRGRKTRRRRLTLGSASYAIVPDKSKRIKIRVKKTARRVLSRTRRRIKVRATAAPKVKAQGTKPTTKTIKVRGSKRKRSTRRSARERR